MSTIHRSLGALAVAGALLVPGAAEAASLSTGVKAVKAHTDKADAALERALVNFERDKDRRGSSALARSRKEMGLATAAAAKLRRSADTASERAAAGKAQAWVAAQRDENVEELAKALDEVDGKADRKVAVAAKSEARGREKAIAVLTALLGEVPADAAAGLSKALAAVSADRSDETKAAAEALAEGEVETGAQETVAETVETSVEGQARADARIAALLADEDTPEQAREGLERARTAIAADHGSVADVLSRFSDRMPARIRDFVSAIVKQAREDAQSMRENRPAPPSGQPEGTPSGAPEQTPSGAPEGTQSGAPEGTTTTQPEGTPSGAPEGTFAP